MAVGPPVPGATTVHIEAMPAEFVSSPSHFTFDEESAEDDIAISNEGVTLLIDPLSFQHLMGAEVDYSEDLQGAQFVIRNPNAATTCGCGSSFSV